MFKQKYDIRQEDNGTWMVYDTETGQPAVRSVLDIQDAARLAESLNRAARQTEFSASR